jgi:uncharacterized iron-regulated membrane protein
LHYSLHFPEIGGTDQWGIWLLGLVALVWTIDCFVGFVLTLPKVACRFWQRWKPAWRVHTKAGAYKLQFDLHRAFSLWTWALLFIVAFTAFSLNLYREQALERARVEARARGWAEPAGGIFHARQYGLYGIDFYRPEDDHGTGGVGHKRLYVDSPDGRVIGERLPWEGTAADLFVQAQFPLHSGRILGLPGRILISAMGLVVAMLAITGVYIWWKKRRARLRHERRAGAPIGEAVAEVAS